MIREMKIAERKSTLSHLRCEQDILKWVDWILDRLNTDKELLLTQARDRHTADWDKKDNVKFVPDSLICSVLTEHGLGCVIIVKSLKLLQLQLNLNSLMLILEVWSVLL